MFIEFLPHLLIASLTLLPLGALFAIFIRNELHANTFSQLMYVLCGASGLVALFFLWGTPIVVFESATIILSLNTFNAFFLALIYAGIVLSSIYNIGSLPHYQQVYSLRSLSVVSAVFMLGLLATVYAGNIFTFLLFWEVMSVSAYFLVIADKTEESLKAGFLYFVMTHIGFAALMAGFFLLSGGYTFAPWDFVAMNIATLDTVEKIIAFLLLFAGFGSKAGLVPLHTWLPHAHPQAPSGSSALLSGVMLKVALFGMLLTVTLIGVLPLYVALIVIAIGIVSALSGVIHAAVDSDAKRLLAWSSIENMGLLFTGVGIFMALLTLPVSPVVSMLMSGVILFIFMHALSHFLFKMGLFMATGIVANYTHTRNLDALGGMAKTVPFFSGIFLVLALAAMALPPLGTFFGEWSLLQSLALGIQSLPLSFAIVSGVLLAAIGLVSGLAIFTFVKMFSAIFLGRARSEFAEVRDLSSFEVIPPFICAILLAISGPVFFPLLASGVPLGTDGFMESVRMGGEAAQNGWHLLGLLALMAFAAVCVVSIFGRHQKVRITDTWDCGAPLTPRMEYTATGFAAPIRFFFKTILVSKKHIVEEPVVPTNSWIRRKTLVWSFGSIVESSLYTPLIRVILKFSALVKRMQSGVIQLYLLFVLVTLIVVLIAAL